MTIPSSRLKLVAPPNAPGSISNKLKWNTHVIAIGNAAGYKKHLPYWKASAEGSWRVQFRDAINTILSVDTESNNARTNVQLHDQNADRWSAPPAIENDPTQAPSDNKFVLKASSKFRNRPRDSQRAARSADLATLVKQNPAAVGALPRAVRTARIAIKREYPNVPALKHDWRDFIYTDGSVLQEDSKIEPGIGAGVYIPAKPEKGRPARTIAVHCKYNSDPEHPECVNTINRAELAAIKVAVDMALTETGTDTEVHIATDSLASMYQIQKAMARPQDITEHRHLLLIKQIVQSIQDSACTVHIWKVKSHIGIVGNEAADQIAVAVSNNRTSDLEAEKETFTDPSNNRSDMYWLYTASGILQKPPQGPSTSDPAADTGRGNPQQAAIVFSPEPNLAESLKKRIHTLRKLGKSNQESVYYGMWKKRAPEINHKFSHAFMTSTLVKSCQRKTIIQYMMAHRVPVPHGALLLLLAA
jgi:ribonuclease HI